MSHTTAAPGIKRSPPPLPTPNATPLHAQLQIAFSSSLESASAASNNTLLPPDKLINPKKNLTSSPHCPEPGVLHGQHRLSLQERGQKGATTEPGPGGRGVENCPAPKRSDTEATSSSLKPSPEDRDRTGTGPGPDRDRTGTGPGPDRDRTGTGPGPDRDRTGTGPGPDRDRTGTGPGPDRDRQRSLHRAWGTGTRAAGSGQVTRIRGQQVRGSEESWPGLQPVVECGDDSVTLTVRKRRAVWLRLDRGEATA
ncbi:hypothetical protein Q5P01_017716 [Channa striata]|uniref:Uncharacterized protein n=1 Tax=Channa striata TaxID=64152 RepID=A0AA88SHR4_CHASR|nr:hypothetical protein Q5P01_017716 [Channa striata]